MSTPGFREIFSHAMSASLVVDANGSRAAAIGCVSRGRLRGLQARALIGGANFRLFDIWPALDEIAISLRDIVAAFIGSLIFLLILWIVRTRGAIRFGRIFSAKDHSATSASHASMSRARKRTLN